MTELKCNSCGAELLPGTSFCRQCGAAITDINEERSEATTALLGNAPDVATTHRLEPRPTSPEPGLRPLAKKNAVSSPARGRRTVVVAGLALVLIIVGILTTVVLIRMRKANATVGAVALSYPGAQTVVDMTNTDGSRAIHLQTKDPLARVENWYQTNLKLSKTVRLTSTSVVMKRDAVTITLAEEDGTTNILIKQAP